MSELEKLSTHELITVIETKDRRFRTAQAIFMGLVFFILSAVVLFQLRTLAGVQEQLKQQSALLQAQKTNTDDLKKNTEQQLAKVSSQLDCIAAFFATRNRTDAVITDLQQCIIVRPDGTIVEPDFKQGASSPNNSTPQAQAPAATTPSQAPSNPQQPADPGPTLPEPVPDPVEILGVPVCVPFTGLCIR